jgi:aminoglycoside phosphotransferase (APT) family kinase protein
LPGPTDYRLPALNPLERIEPRIDAAPVPADDKKLLMGLCAQLREQWRELDFPLPQGVVHGDAHVQNLMIADGQPVLIDFERVAWGQPEWDLAKTATEFQLARFYTASQYREFADAYGFDVTTWSGFPVLRSAMGLGMTTWLMQNAQHDATIAAEYKKRVLTLRGRSSEQWKPF